MYNNILVQNRRNFKRKNIKSLLGKYGTTTSKVLKSEKNEHFENEEYCRRDIKREELFGLLYHARGVFLKYANILKDHGFSLPNGNAFNVHQTCKCHYISYVKSKCNRVGHGKPAIYGIEKDKRAEYGGLATCKSVWSCPVCALSSYYKKADELRKLVNHFYRRPSNMKAIFVTYTFSHSFNDELRDLMDRFQKTLSSTFSGSKWKSILDKYGVVGSVKSLECTWGIKNGWHPHAHFLYFVPCTTNADDFKEEVLDRYFDFAEKNGLVREGVGGKEEFYERAIVVEDNAKTSDYLAKIESSGGIDKEMSNSFGKTSGFSAFDFLRVAEYCKTNKIEGMRRYFDDMYLEYSLVFRGRRKLYLSKGLRDIIDAYAVEEEKEEKKLLACIDVNRFGKINRDNMLARVLYAVERRFYHQDNSIVGQLIKDGYLDEDDFRDTNDGFDKAKWEKKMEDLREKIAFRKSALRKNRLEVSGCFENVFLGGCTDIQEDLNRMSEAIKKTHRQGRENIKMMVSMLARKRDEINDNSNDKWMDWVDFFKKEVLKM